MAETTGKLRYLGHSSTYAFTQQVLHLADQTPASNPSPEILLGWDNAAWKTESCRLTPPRDPDISKLPSKDICLHYLHTVKFRTQPLYYLFDETHFFQCVDEFYQSPYEYAQSNPIWLAHYLVLMAFGKAMDPVAQHVSTVSNLFTRALLLLPDMAYLCEHPVESTELCCSMALYLQSIHYRQAALIYVSFILLENSYSLKLGRTSYSNRAVACFTYRLAGDSSRRPSSSKRATYLVDSVLAKPEDHVIDRTSKLSQRCRYDQPVAICSQSK